MYRPAFELADILRQSGPAYRQNHGLTSEQDRAIDAILNCRTAALGGRVEECCECSFTHQLQLVQEPLESPLRGESKTAPKCQSAARTKWVEAREAELLPVEYFHVVSTLPEPIARIAYYNRKEVYNILFGATAQTLTTIAGDPQHLGADIGFFAVLHTWGQNLLHHPHLHCVVPGDGLSPDGESWVSCMPGFFLPVRVLSRLFRRLFLESLETAFRKGKLSFFGDLAGLQDPVSSCVIWLL